MTAWPDCDGEVGRLPRADLEADSLSASLKPWLRSWVSGRQSMPAISPMTGLLTPLPSAVADVLARR